MIPIQERAVDPFSSYESENVNRLTRVLTAGEDKIARDTDLFPTKASDTIINITDGVAIKDDVMLHIEDTVGLDGFQTLDITDPLNYILQAGETSLMEAPFPAVAYLVLQYVYVKTPQVPEAQILILKHPEDLNPELHIFLGKITFSATNVIQSIDPEDTSVFPNVVRPVANLTDAYTDAQARAADALNPITNHRAADPADYNKLVGTDSTTGEIILISFDDARKPTNIEETFNGSAITVTHNLGTYPIVQVIDNDGGSDQGELIQAIIVHTNENEFTVDFDANQSTPLDIIIVY